MREKLVFNKGVKPLQTNLEQKISNSFSVNMQWDIQTRPDTRHKMRLVSVLFTFENNAGPTDGPTDGHDLI